MSEEHVCVKQQCRLSIETATILNDFIAQSRLDRQECETRYANDRRESKEFRDEILKKIDELTKSFGAIVPSVETGRKIAWGVASAAGVTVISGFIYGIWKFIKFTARYL